MATKRSAASGEKSTAKKSTAKKSTAKKSTAKKSTAKKSTAKKSTDTGTTDRRSSGAPRAAAPKRATGLEMAGSAARQLRELTGREAEGVTGLERTEDGWTIQIEVVELRRVPDTTDLLALYEVEVDSDGDLQGYRRLRRYVRGVAGDDER